MKTIKKGSDYQTDAQLKDRIRQLKEYFKTSEQNYIEFGGYYIELRKMDKSNGIRWFHRNKYKVEVVFEREGAPHQNIAGFVLFSNINDALLHACLRETSELARLKRLEKEQIKD